MPGQQHVAPARRLVLTLEKGLVGCAAEAAAYGQCVTASAEIISRHACQAQFEAFKACAQKTLKRRW
ncbi:hypothetical protein IW150_006897 [Coemansia sp. RSA 2607]|nr:hypothetical protein IW150_006897 [Coemansia sp. RSA 2607]KAJ2388020.1 hypothetical protein GGI05_003909 [Coemansia sp. RSA 2603]